MPNDTMNFGVDLLPVTSNTYYLGSNDKKWILNASSIDGPLTITEHTKPNSNGINYYPWFGTTTSGNASVQAHSAIYIHETINSSKITGFDLCVGSSSIKGGITLWDGSNNYGYLQIPSLSGNKTYTLPSDAGTLALQSDVENSRVEIIRIPS